MFARLFLNFCILVFTIVLWLPQPTLARPVSYPGGWTFMTKNNWERSRAHFHYSPSRFYSFGLSSEYYKETHVKTLSFQTNRLLKRINKSGSQTNLYLKAEAGTAFRDSGEYQPHFSGALTGDWETRRYFAGFKLAAHYLGDYDDGSAHQMLTFGVAPYLGNYGSLHTWLMVQLGNHPEEEVQTRITPMVRLFKGDYLAEIGVDSEKDFLFNFVYRY